MHTDAQSLVARGDRLFSKKLVLDSRNQDIAEHFYLERADFTVSRTLGTMWGEGNATGYPALVHRDLSNSIGSMLRPKGKQWMHIRAAREENEDHDGKKWLEAATGLQRRAMEDRKALFSRATSEGDKDFAAFGNAVISTEVNRRDTSLLYRCWHLRDCAWMHDSYGQMGELHRNWKPTVSELCEYFPGKVDPRTEEMKDRDPHALARVRHVVIRTDAYTGKYRQPWVSMFIDCEHHHILEERGSWTQIYTVPAWATVSGSQYGYSPAVTIALPDARLIQAMTLSLLSAGERAADPPMIGVQDALRSDLNLAPGGFTAVDRDYDERLGEVLRPLNQDTSGLRFGMEMLDRTGGMLRSAFFLNVLSMPPVGGPDMTAYEFGQRIQENIRQLLPLFGPMEDNYNGMVCEITFDTLMHENAFGPPESIPESIRGGDVQFVFESPLSQMVERQKGQTFIETKSMLAQAVDVDPGVMEIVDFKTALRDVLSGIGTPEKWLRSPDDVAKADAKAAQAENAQQVLATMQQGADVAATLGQASQTLGPM